MNFRLDVEMNNAAFDEPNSDDELARILVFVANRVRYDGDDVGLVRDINGNVCGDWRIS